MEVDLVLPGSAPDKHVGAPARIVGISARGLVSVLNRQRFVDDHFFPVRGQAERLHGRDGGSLDTSRGFRDQFRPSQVRSGFDRRSGVAENQTFRSVQGKTQRLTGNATFSFVRTASFDAQFAASHFDDERHRSDRNCLVGRLTSRRVHTPHAREVGGLLGKDRS